MSGADGRGRWRGAAVAFLMLTAGAANAQTVPAAAPAPKAGPGSVAWPQPTLPPNTPPLPPPTLEAPPSPFGAPAREPVSFTPLPGSLEDQISQEFEARKLFRLCWWDGTTVTAFPRGLLWQPPFAAKREPRMLLLGTTLDNTVQTWTLDTSIGTTVGLWRAEPIGHDIAFQFDIAAVVHTRLTPEDLVASDYRFAFPLSVRWGPWHGKIAYEHTSSHIGDELIRSQRITDIRGLSQNELVVGVGRWMWDQLRVYGQASYAFNHAYPIQSETKFDWRFDVGFEWYHPGPTGWAGTPFVALNLDSRGDQDFEPNVNVQAGWLWRNPYERLANVRLFGEYYNGFSPYGAGPFFRAKESFFAVGLSCDY